MGIVKLRWGLTWPIEVDLYHMGSDAEPHALCGKPWDTMRWHGYVHYAGSQVCPTCAQRYSQGVLEGTITY